MRLGPAGRCHALALAASAAAAVAPATAATPASAAPPSDPTCLGLVAGSTGLIGVGGAIPSVDQLTGRPGGFGRPAPPALASSLPETIAFRTATETFSNEYAFALREGLIYVRRAEFGRALPGTEWHELELPACLAGRVTEISADHRLLIAIGPERQIYAHDMPGGDLAAQRWTWRWGPYLWTGSGMKMPGDVRQWATSEFTSAETFRDSSGRQRHPIGVATVYLLRAGGRRITYLDPWLPNDESREVCTPRRGTTEFAGISGSGSTVFGITPQGRPYTRLYDFDVSGANTVFGRYTWERERPASDPRWQLPGPEWVRHRRPPGPITSRVSIAKTGPDASDRLLRIAGRRRPGARNGYWEKRIDERSARGWRFVPTGGPPAGRRLVAGTPAAGTPAPHDRRYAGTVGAVPVTVPDFNPECSPATLRVRLPDAPPLDLILHASDGLRQASRARGLDDAPREYNGAIEIPARTWRRLDQLAGAHRTWIDENLDGRFTTTPLAVTETRLRFLAQCWELTLDGEAARPDQIVIPPDLGAFFGRFTEAQQDGRPPAGC